MFAGYYKMPAPQTEQENCVAHNGSLDPGARAATSWCRPGIRAACRCSTSPTRRTPVEIAFFDRGPIDAKQLIIGGYWSAYWYNGHIYGSEIARGLDVFKLMPSEYLSQNEIDAASSCACDEFNAAGAAEDHWPASAVVARAYLDQLNATQAHPAGARRAVKTALDRADGVRTGKDKGAAAVCEQLDALAAQLETDAAAGSGRDAARLRALAATLKGATAKLRG